MENRISIGKRNEFSVWAKLLEEGIDIFPALVDDKGIDGIIGYKENYFEVQIKSGKKWENPRGISYEVCVNNENRIFIIYNYTLKEIRFLTGRGILNEPEWQKTIKWDIPQLKWNKKLLDKYNKNNFEGLVNFIKK